MVRNRSGRAIVSDSHAQPGACATGRQARTSSVVAFRITGRLPIRPRLATSRITRQRHPRAGYRPSTRMALRCRHTHTQGGLAGGRRARTFSSVHRQRI
eukprot:550345-Prymnesium_polylepis.1